jgi:TolB-like protein/Tfp pilus assembly protein PilF
MRVYSLDVGGSHAARPPANQAKQWASKPRWPSIPLVAVAALVLLAAAGGWAILGSRLMKTPQAAHLSIVVLPFANLSGDPSQDYFADGITENLTTALSRIKGSFVIARNTAFTFKGKSVDAKEIGKALGVRYVLEGSVQCDQNRVRVNAQLVDADSGAHLWAQRFEEDVADLFKLQDQVVARLANTLGNELIKAEASKGARSTNPDANDLVMRASALENEQSLQPSNDRNNAERALFEQALAIDPNNASAIEGLAQTYANEHLYGWGNSGTDCDAKVLGPLDRAIALAPDYDGAYATKSYYLELSHRFDEAIRVANAGLAVNPNNQYLYHARAEAEVSLGRLDEARSDLQQAIRLSPDDPWRVDFDRQFGSIEFAAGHLEAAIDAYHKALDAGDRSQWPYISLAALYALLGKTDKAKPYVAETLRLNPNFTVKWMREHAIDIPLRNEGLRKAGFKEE